MELHRERQLKDKHFRAAVFNVTESNKCLLFVTSTVFSVAHLLTSLHMRYLEHLVQSGAPRTNALVSPLHQSAQGELRIH